MRATTMQLSHHSDEDSPQQQSSPCRCNVCCPEYPADSSDTVCLCLVQLSVPSHEGDTAGNVLPAHGRNTCATTDCDIVSQSKPSHACVTAPSGMLE